MSSFGLSTPGPTGVEFVGLRVSQLPNYVVCDQGRARCRVSASSPIVRLPNIKIGRIVRLKLTMDKHGSNMDRNSKQVEVICTLWPDSDNVLQPHEIAIDDTVVVGSRMDWTRCSCKIETVFVSKPASSIKFSAFHNKTSDAGYSAMNRLPFHLPVIANSSVHLPASVSPTGLAISTVIHSVFPATATTPMLTNHMTVFVPISGSIVTDPTTNIGFEEPSVARTKVVEQLLTKMVLPLVRRDDENSPLVPRFALYRGIMLLGPPGVGKTFAVQAVQALCRQQLAKYIKIDIVPLSIPELLSSEDPITTLQSILPKLPEKKLVAHTADSRSSPVKSSTTSTATSVSPMQTPASNFKSGFSFRSPTIANTTPAKTADVQATSSLQKGFSFSASSLKQPFPPSKFSPVIGSVVSPIKTPLSMTTPTKTISKPKALIFFVVDEIDALGHRHRQNDSQIAIKLLLCDWLDRLQNMEMSGGENGHDEVHYAMIATSNRSEDVDVCFRRGGRLEQESIVLLTKEDRKLLWRSYLQQLVIKLSSISVSDETTYPSQRIVEMMTFLRSVAPCLTPSNSLLSADGDETLSSVQEVNNAAWNEMLEILGETSGGYVAADIASVVSDMDRQFFSTNTDSIKSSSSSSSRTNNGGEMLSKMQTLLDSQGVQAPVHMSSTAPATLLWLVYATMRKIPPSCLRGVSVTTPKLTLDDVIGHHDAKVALRRVLQFTNPRMQPVLKRFGLHEGLGGVLLYGPPGNSKTRLIAAIATSYHLPLLSLSSADVYSAYVGDAEAEVRRAFALARQAAPCILFFDELDSLVLNRAQHPGAASSSSVEARVLSTFLNEMDGVTVSAQAAAAGILVMAATNRIDCIDAALLRKGRFYQSIYVAPPTAEDRRALLQYFGTKAQLASDVIDDLLQNHTWEGMSGADVENVCKEAAVTSFHKQMLQRNLS